MTDKTTEAVARALCARQCDPDMCVMGSGGTAGEPSACYQRAWELHIPAAQAAIAAHLKALEEAGKVVVDREPTEAMLSAKCEGPLLTLGSEKNSRVQQWRAGLWAAMIAAGENE